MAQMDAVSNATATPSHRPDGTFAPGNRAARGGVRDNSSRKFTAWVRAFLEEPETQEKIRAKVLRDLDGDGPGTFAARMIAYGYGEPKQTIEHVALGEIQRIADECGVTPEMIIAESERLATLATADAN